MPRSRLQGLVRLRDDEPEKAADSGSSARSESTTDSPSTEVSQVNARVPAELHKRLKLFAVEHEKEIKDIVAEAIRSYLEEHR